MKALTFLLSVSLWFLAFSAPVPADPSAQGTPPTPSLMPAGRAKAMFEDERVKTFLATVTKEFGGTCSIPDYTKTEATLTQRGSGDFSSSFYEVNVSCPGKNGLAAIQIIAEFSPPRGRPLNLILSLYFKQ